MINCNDNDRIISYIENELNESERKLFESELETDLELKKEYDSTRKLINSLNKLPKVKASGNFIVSLNCKIDEYEKNKNFKWIFSSISSLFNSYPKYSFASSFNSKYFESQNITVGISAAKDSK